MAEPETPPLPAATFEAHSFQPTTLEEFGADVSRRLIGRPLSTVSLFMDSKTRLPALFLVFSGVPGVLVDEGLLISPRPTTALLEPVIAIFQGGLEAELARQQAGPPEGPPVQEAV